MKWMALIGLVVSFAACSEGPVNSKACANHPPDWCGQGMRCLVVGDQSKCVVAGDAGSDSKDLAGDSMLGGDIPKPSTDADAAEPDSTPTVDVATPLDVVGPDSDATADRPAEVAPIVDAMPDGETGGGPVCGDRVVTPPEECDLGTAMNTGAYGGCTPGCKNGPRCGDGTKNGSEQCDNGAANNDTTYNGCKLNCTLGPRCGDGHQDSSEECDQGAANNANAYGKGLCTNACKTAPYCGDAKTNGTERCDNGATGATELGACNPECSGFYEKKTIKPTNEYYSTNLGGPSGADGSCQKEFGASWKAFLVGGSRRATRTPFKGDDPQDWVIHKYTHYYNVSGQLLWRTDEIPLLGVHDGKRENIYADAFQGGGSYPWTGWAADWTTLPEDPTKFQGTCQGWTLSSGGGWASFAFPTLMPAASENCGSSSFILCAEQ
jgi:hypothetical protein